MERILAILLLLSAHELCAQFGPPKVSVGLVYSDIRYPSDEDIENGNDWKRGYWGSLGVQYSIPKLKWLALEGNLVYQERKALETFSFPFKNDPPIAGGSFQLFVVDYPTSPQSEGFENYNYKHFPNFKYLNLELIPLVRFGAKLKMAIGAGVFGGILLNRSQTTVTREDLIAEVQFWFEPPFNAFGATEYRKYDFGIVPKVSVSYAVNHKISLGISIKSYQSLVRLNETFDQLEDLHYNMRWVAYSGGIDLEYQF